MFRINGIGLSFDGVSKPDHEGNCTATQWFTFIFIPIFPIARYKLKPIKKVPFRFEFQTISKQKIVLTEILQTYLFGWILFPALIFAPLVLVGVFANTQIPLILLAIAWLIVSVWKLRTWDYERWFKRSAL